MPGMPLDNFLQFISQFPPDTRLADWLPVYREAVLRNEPPPTLPPGVVWPTAEEES